MNLDAEAKRIANRLAFDQCEPHRGVAPMSQSGLSVVFGNDGYRQWNETREEVRLLLEKAHQEKIEVAGFAVDDQQGACWALVLRCEDLDWLKARLHDAFFQSHHLESASW